ncbi:sensor histidine kinase [Mediterraneibacter gnavus]|uniref:sensor histidine kinase n=1 Tax=Mediterraneibacter gnavus TaxID=33038 RepID=UPI0004BCC823|nr:sensor histidine kinase [Mediterraneibacter gnavus]
MREGKNGQIRGTLKRRLITNFLLTALIPVLIFAIISQINIQQRLKENLSDRIKSNLDTAEKNLEMVLDKYETILYDFSTDEDVLEIVKALNESRGNRESNSTSLRKKLSHICNQFTGVEGITIQLKKGEIIYYESLSSFSRNETWADKVKIPKIERGAVYFGDGKPVKIADKNHYMFYIARNITDYRIIGNFQGTVVLSVNEERIRRAIASDIGSREYLLSDDVIVSAPDPKKIGKKLSEIQDPENYQYTTADNEISGFAICNEQPLAYYWKMSVSQWIYFFIIISMTIVIVFILLHFFSRPYIQAVESITGVMSCVEQGEFDQQVRVNPHLPMEIQQISSGFNEMVAHLEMLIAKVKQAVLDQKNAELSALEAQIDPHFLYNTLDTINWKAIENEQYEISGMVGALADILRYTVKNAGGTASISEEIAWLKQYIMLQSAKFGKRLDVKIYMPEDVKECRIHKLLLQPFVENTIKYAFADQEECALNIRMKKSGEQLHILIQDNGQGMNPDMVARLNQEECEMEGHLGIANVRKRLKLYYGGQAALYFESEVGNYTKVHLFIPIEEETTCVL